MHLSAGTILTSTEALNGSYFEKATIVLSQYNSAGAVGFIINKLYPRNLAELEEYDKVSFPLYEGGPVNQEHLYVIHQRPQLIEGSTRIGEGLYFGGKFDEVINGIKNGTLTTHDVKIFIGYCGWNANELEGEIKEGSWALVTGVRVF